MIIALLLIGLVINQLFFYDYYLKAEKEEILEFADAYDSLLGDDEAVSSLVDDMTSKKQVKVAIVTNSNVESFNFSLLRSHLSYGRMGQARVELDYPENSEEVFETKGYLFLTFTEGQYKLPTMALLYQLSTGEVLLVTMPYEVINRTADIAIRFNVMIAGVLIFIGMLVVFLMAKSMTKPIIKLSKMTKKMANLDFSERFEKKRNDEIGALGDHVNKMSETLEETLISLKSSNDQLIVDLKEKEKIVEMRKSFIGNISHELKTPIALIMSYVEGLKDNQHLTAQDKHQYFEVIEKETDHMHRLVKDLLDLTELEYDATQLICKPFDFSSLIDEILDRYFLWIREKELKIIFDKEDIMMITGDKKRFEQAVTNYIINGLDHCEDKGQVEIRAKHRDDQLFFSVTNSGSQLNIDNPEQLFHRFYQETTHEKRTLGGSGIGLSIVAAVVEKHGGRYGAENVDQGVMFWFEVPVEN
jgi:signal transduction histidine kinase